MEAKISESWPKGDFLYEPKWDGFRSISCLNPRSGSIPEASDRFFATSLS
jgi:hypothetical protein